VKPESAALSPVCVVPGAVATAIGELRVACTAAGVVAVALPGEDLACFERHTTHSAHHAVDTADGRKAAEALIERTTEELAAYVAGRLQQFTVPLSTVGTAFQQLVWRAVCAVPYGKTTTYGAVAAALGRPLAARAVGHANGSNPLPIIIPCHRLVGRDGSLTGYGGGLPLKRWLIEHERLHV
jgi:methylated-DNA-[protein]-cysteine S-methyltransferase